MWELLEEICEEVSSNSVSQPIIYKNNKPHKITTKIFFILKLLCVYLYKYIFKRVNCQVHIHLIKCIKEVHNKIMIRIKLDKFLTCKKISRYELAKRTGIQYQIIDNYYKNKIKRYDGFVLERICEALECDVTDIIEYKKDH